MGELARRLNADGKDTEQYPVSTAQLAALLTRIADGTISNNAARQVLDALWARPHEIRPVGIPSAEAIGTPTISVDSIIEAKGLKQLSDTGALEKIIDEVLAANAKNVAEVRAGNAKAMNALVGQAMKATQGKANPAQVNELLKKKLA